MFSVFAFFVRFLRRKSWRQINQNWLRRHINQNIFLFFLGCFHTWATADCYTSPTGGNRGRRSMVAQYHKTKIWTRCLSQSHATRAQFFVIVLRHGCQLLETLVAVERNPKIEKEKLAGRQVTPTFRCRGLAAAAQITPWCRKKSATPPHAIPLPHCMNGIRHSDVLCSRFLPSPLPFQHCICTACMESQLYTDHFHTDLFSLLCSSSQQLQKRH